MHAGLACRMRAPAPCCPHGPVRARRLLEARRARDSASAGALRQPPAGHLTADTDETELAARIGRHAQSSRRRGFLGVPEIT